MVAPFAAFVARGANPVANAFDEDGFLDGNVGELLFGGRRGGGCWCGLDLVLQANEI